MPMQSYDIDNALLPVTDRLPGPNDDTTKGYTTSSLWLFRGQLFSPVSVAAGCATWVRLNARRANIVDLLGATAVFAGGTIALKTGYVGAAIDISVTIAAAAVAATINILASGELDVATLMATMAKQDAGTRVVVTKIYDQTGGNNHLTQFSTSAMPYLIYDEVLERYVVTGENASAAQFLANATAPVVTGNNCAMFALGRPLGAADNGSLVVGSFGQYTGVGTNAIVLQTATNGGLQTWSTQGGTNLPPQPYPAMEMGPSIVGLISRSTGAELFANEQSSIASAQSSTQTYTGCFFGTDNISAGRYLAVRTLGFVLANAAPSVALATAIKQSAYTLMRVPVQAKDVVVHIGDSRFGGFRTNFGESIPFQIKAASRRPHRALNFGRGSQTALQMITTTVPQAIRYYSPGNKNISVLLASVNDFIVNAATPETAFDYLKQIGALLRAAGFYHILIAELDATSASQHNFLVAVRALILSTGAAGMNADEIIDVSTLAPVVTPANTNFYPDGLHAGSALTGLIGAVVGRRVDQLLAMP